MVDTGSAEENETYGKRVRNVMDGGSGVRPKGDVGSRRHIICRERASRSGPPRLLRMTRAPQYQRAAYRQALPVVCCLC
jgi:hypothetical protein